MTLSNATLVLLLTTGLIALPRFSQAATTADLVKITGLTVNDYFGYESVSGDINGDGYEDIIFGSYNATVTGSTDNGVINIIYGSATSLTDQTADASNVVTYTGEYAYDWAGLNVGAADIDGDGYDDILVGAPQYGYQSGSAWGGAVYIIYGSANNLTGGSLATTVRITSAQDQEYLGYDVNSLGDVDGDGYYDFGVGSLFYDNTGTNAEGATYIVYGSATRFTNTSIGSIATRFVGEGSGDSLGSSVNGVGDMNGDGYDDWMTGAPYYGETNVGALYVIYGSATRPAAGSIGQFPRLTGERQDDYVSYMMTSAGDMNGDGLADAIIGVSNANTDTLTDVGHSYIIYGSATALTSQVISAFPKISGIAASDLAGLYVTSGRLNNDTYSDIIIAAPYTDSPTANSGTVYLILGQASQYTSTSVTSIATTTFIGENMTDNFGYGLALTDLNGDNYDELIVGSPNDDTTASSAGAAYIAYLRVDIDEDGVLSSTGLLEAGTDCNDSDGTVSSNQTYYLDADEDGLGVSDTTTSVCSSTPPTGYADNANDTNDDIKNNDQEIADDGVDNDGDGVIDETNTISENGGHPEYKTIDPTDAEAVAAALVSVRTTSNGKIRVRFADDTVYLYAPFSGQNLKRLKIKAYPETGYYVVLLANGRKMALLNVLNGRVRDRQRWGTKTYAEHYLQFDDLRNDGVMDIVLASQTQARFRLAIAGINLSKEKFVHPERLALIQPKAKVKKTTIVGNTIDVRSKTLPLVTVLVTKQFNLTEL